MQKRAIRGDPLPHQVHYYSNVGDRLPELGDEERETRQTFQELVQLGHTCVVLLRRAIWSVDPTVFNPQYNLQVPLRAASPRLAPPRPAPSSPRRTSPEPHLARAGPPRCHGRRPARSDDRRPDRPCVSRCAWTRSTRRWGSWRARRGSTSRTRRSSRSASPALSIDVQHTPRGRAAAVCMCAQASPPPCAGR
jgi:hypothetical protein